MVENARFSRRMVSNATWHLEKVTYGKSYVANLNVWFIISHMIDDAIKINKGIKKKEKIK